MSGNDFMPIDGWDHLEIWVGNAKQAAYFYESAFGFTRTAYAGPETGVRDRASYVLEQGDIRLVLTSGLRGDSEVCRWAATKGDSVRDVALSVPDATNAYRQAVQRGARGVAEPHWVEDEHGRVELSAIGTYGDNIHTFVNRSEYRGPYLPGFRSASPADSSNGGPSPAGGVGLISIDHVVGNVELGRMDEWVGFYERVLGFTQLTHFSDEDISTEYSALMSKVMTDGEGKIKFPINEPAEGKRKSQIEEYLDFHGGPGVQHVAMQTDDIVKTVAALREHGVLFITTPDTYYDDVEERVGEIEEDWADLRSMGILADRDEDGYLLQLFTKIVQDRPTLFFEVIERHGSRGFGLGNFKALFEAIEREQALRGNL
jgi:4-hydroxyphenylpyruvate dioxygenase